MYIITRCHHVWMKCFGGIVPEVWFEACAVSDAGLTAVHYTHNLAASRVRHFGPSEVLWLAHCAFET